MEKPDKMGIMMSRELSDYPIDGYPDKRMRLLYRILYDSTIKGEPSLRKIDEKYLEGQCYEKKDSSSGR